MNIAILTQPLFNNYGAILQNYALQKILQNFGHSSITINYKLPIIPWYLRILIGIKRFILKYIFRANGISWIDPLREGYEFHLRNDGEMIRFVGQYIHSRIERWPLSPRFVNNNSYEAYIVGSDQIWRADYTAYLYNYFLDFVRDSQIKKVAYAASFGVDSLNPKQYNIKKISRLLQQFAAISVREMSGVTICKEIFGCNAMHVLDPTLLLTADDYINFLHLSPKEPEGLIAYILDNTPQKQQIVEQISRRLHQPIKYIGHIQGHVSSSIESWLEGIMNAKFVITDSFHGSVFSIIFEKTFITIDNSDRGTSRITSLFEMLGIDPRRILSQGTKQIPEFAPIEYTKIRERLAIERLKSKDFLSRALQ